MVKGVNDLHMMYHTPMNFFTEKLRIPSSNHARKIVKDTLWVEALLFVWEFRPFLIPFV